MAIIDFLKGKKGRELPLPPPPSPREMSNFSFDNPPIPKSRPQFEAESSASTPVMFRGDFDSIRPPQTFDMPSASSESSLPDFPPSLPAPAEEKEVTVFDRTLTQEGVEFKKSEVEKVRVLPQSAFIAVEDYKRIVNDTNAIRARVMTAEGFAKKLAELKADEDRSLERWRSHLEDVEKKLAYVDQLIEKAEKV